MSAKGKTIKLGVAAVAIAAMIIAATYFVTPAILTNTQTTGVSQSYTSNTSQGTQASSSQVASSPTYLVLLTDPPQVPAGTEQLNLTYSGVSLQLTAPNGSSRWVSVSVSGTVDLVSLGNWTQTIASTKVPAGSQVVAISLDISGIQAEVNGTVQAVTPISKEVTFPVGQPAGANQNLTGAILDLVPSLAQTEVVNASSGATADSFVFVPSGVAIGSSNLNQSQAHIGDRTKLSAGDARMLDSAQSQAASSISATSEQLSVSGNKTTFSVTLKNSGSSNATIFGLLLSGQLNMSMTLPIPCNPLVPVCPKSMPSIVHPGVIPFRINGTSLQPLLGFEGQQATGNVSSITIAAGQSVTLSFSGVIGVQVSSLAGGHAPASPSIALAPVAGQSYTIRLMGVGFLTFQVTAS